MAWQGGSPELELKMARLHGPGPSVDHQSFPFLSACPEAEGGRVNEGLFWRRWMTDELIPLRALHCLRLHDTKQDKNASLQWEAD